MFILPHQVLIAGVGSKGGVPRNGSGTAPSVGTKLSSSTASQTPDGEGQIQKWDLATGTPLSPSLCEFSGNDLPGSMTLLPGPPAGPSGLVALNRTRGALLYYQLARERPVHRFYGQEGGPSCLAVHPDGLSLVMGAEGGKLMVWQMATGEQLVRLEEAHYARIVVARFSTDGSHLITGSADGSVRIWSWTALLAARTDHVHQESSSPPPLLHTFTEHTQGITDVQVGFGVEGNFRLVTVAADGMACLYDCLDGSLMAKFTLPAPLASVLMTADETLVLVGAVDGVIYLLDLATTGIECDDDMRVVGLTSAVAASSVPLKASLQGHSSPITSMCLSLDETHLISGDAGGHICCWRLANKQLVRRINAVGPIVSMAITCKAFLDPSPTDKLIVGQPKRGLANELASIQVPLLAGDDGDKGDGVEAGPSKVMSLPRDGSTGITSQSALGELQRSYSKLLDHVFSKYHS